MPTAGSYSIEASGTNVDNNPTELAVTVAERGHFVFRDNGGREINSLSLSPSDTGMITLNNTGGSAISGIALTFSPAAISSSFSG